MLTSTEVALNNLGKTMPISEGDDICEDEYEVYAFMLKLLKLSRTPRSMKRFLLLLIQALVASIG